MSDDLDSDDLYVRPEFRQKEAVARGPREDSSEAPKEKRRRLLSIAADRAEPYHVRSEAQRILDIGDTMPASEFAYRCVEFFNAYSPVTPGEVMGQ